MEETQLLWDPDQRDPRGRLRILTGSQQAQSGEWRGRCTDLTHTECV